MSNKRKVAYFYDDDIPTYYYGHEHPMKPKRIAMTHSLINHYKLYSHLYVYEPNHATKDDLTLFHSPEYIDFLEKVSGKNTLRILDKKNPFKIGDSSDCPFFQGVYNFSQKSAGGSIDCAYMINEGAQNICINWAGGLHHAKKNEASGFCYINDIVLCILVLLRYHPRVLYIDIDVHHGDGVEEAFYLTNRVMTVSFHQYGKDFFPGTGHHESVGKGEGLYYSVNVPLYPGMDDTNYTALYKDVIKQVIDKYQPNAIVLQCGADSLNEDKLGQFNLTTRGHAECVDFTLKLGIPTVMLGGGGYTIENVARCWTNETAVALQMELDNKLPPNEYSNEYTSPYLHVEKNPNVENLNNREYLDKVRKLTFERLKLIEAAPGIQVSAEYPQDLMFQDELDFIDMMRERALDKKYDEEGYDVSRKNGSQSILVSKANSEDAGLSLGMRMMSSSILVPKISDSNMDIETSGTTQRLTEQTAVQNQGDATSAQTNIVTNPLLDPKGSVEGMQITMTKDDNSMAIEEENANKEPTKKDSTF